MSHSKKDGKHGGGHKLHWTRDNNTGRCPFGFMDVHIKRCTQCQGYSTCLKHCRFYKKKDRTIEKYKDEI